MQLALAEARYEGLRAAARHATQEASADVLPQHGWRDAPFELSLCPIDAAALNFWEAWWHGKQYNNGGPVGFSWDLLAVHFRKRPKRFEVALWGGSTLCALAVGLPSRGEDNLTLHFLERYWGTNPISGYIAPIVIDAADNYAAILGKRSLKIKNPVRGAVHIYETLGFELATSGIVHSYYAREVKK